MAGYPKRVSIVRGTEICVSMGSLSLIFTVEEFRDLAEKGIALCDTIDRRTPLTRNHLDGSESSGGSRLLGSSDAEG